MFNPEKSSVYRRYLPEGFRYDDSWTDRLLANLEEQGVDCVNNKELLTEKSYEEQVFNRRYDAGHWSGTGAYYGTNNLWEHMSKDLPAVTAYTPDDFTIDSKIAEYYPASVIPVNEEIPVYILKKDWEWITDQYAGEIELDPRYPYFQYATDPSGESDPLPRVMVFHGSYYNEKPSFLIGKVREYIGIHDYQNVLNLDYYFNIFQPDAVVFEVAEYTLENSYFDQEKMTALDFNPGIQGKISGPISGTEAAEEIHIKPGEKLDTLSWKTTADVDYAYLLSDGKVYDLRRTGTGLFQATVPHNAVYGDPVLCAKNGNEDTFLPVHLTGGQKNRKGLSFSSGTRYDEDGDCFILEPKGEALFSGVDLQLFDAVSGQYLDTILTVHAADSYRGTYLHERGTGN